MSIIRTFDNNSEEIIHPSAITERIKNFPETVIASFSCRFTELFHAVFEMKQISHMAAGGGRIPIYQFEYKGQVLGYYQTILGGPASAALLEEILAKGGKNVLYFGSCGSLDKTITGGHLIVPTSAYRDEGTSYHYAPPGDYIEIETAGRLAEIFDELGVRYRKTKTWTTDAFYRETRNGMEARKKEGCSVVEMECASVMAAGSFRGASIYQFLYTADCLDGSEWNTGILGRMPDDLRESILKIALETAIRI